MNIGLDYDDTYTRDPELWTAFIATAHSHGHDVYIVTWRDKSEASLMDINPTARKYLSGIYPTNRHAKEKFMYNQGIRIDVWIDDNARAIIQDMEKY